MLAGAMVTAYAVMPKARAVPNVRGESIGDARASIERAGLRLGTTTEVFHDTVPRGEIVDVAPAPGTRVKEGTIVAISVSKGAQLFNVPIIVGKQVDEARGLLAAAGFSLVVADEQYSDSVAVGAVISRDPSVTGARRGASVSVIVSKGPQFVPIPSVSGDTPDAAKTALEAAGFVYAERSDFSDAVADGTVIKTDPAGKAPKGATVTAVVSKGPRPFPVPDFVGMILKAAKDKAEAAGLVVRNTYAVPGSGKPKGQVQGQNPPVGTDVRKGTPIDLWYSV
jgi:serine/threonine-protein kinase